jgi:hypothetical protein
MAVSRMLDRVKDGIEQVLTDRCAPDDEIEFDCTLGVQTIHIEDDEDTEACRNISVVSMYVSMKMPECGPQARAITHIMVPARNLEEVWEVEEVGHDLWESLSGSRIMAQMDAEIEQAAHSDDEGA